ncbi:MAG: hypothetical protein NW215_02750 [Hyphomicrobiales bacterium]|nr:hypothetical protein [Hyphomicrobiales bacterium]
MVDILPGSLSHENVLKNLSRRISEIKEKKKNLPPNEFLVEYDLEKRYQLAWALREEIKQKISVNHSYLKEVSKGNIYSLFLSRNINYGQAHEIRTMVVAECEFLHIRVLGSGGGLDAPLTHSTFADVAVKIRNCEALLAIVTPRNDENTNIWIVAEVSMALALQMPVFLLIHDEASDEQWGRLGDSYRKLRFNDQNFSERIKAAIKELDEWVYNSVTRQKNF